MCLPLPASLLISALVFIVSSSLLALCLRVVLSLVSYNESLDCGFRVILSSYNACNAVFSLSTALSASHKFNKLYFYFNSVQFGKMPLESMWGFLSVLFNFQMYGIFALFISLLLISKVIPLWYENILLMISEKC